MGSQLEFTHRYFNLNILKLKIIKLQNITLAHTILCFCFIYIIRLDILTELVKVRRHMLFYDSSYFFAFILYCIILFIYF